MDYLYITAIYRDTSNLIGFDIVQNDLDKTDFQTNYKSSCNEVTEISFAETTARIEKTYTQFKALITGDLVWSDVKLSIMNKKYELYLITQSPL